MGAEALQHGVSVFIGIATAESYDLDVFMAQRQGDLLAHVVSALNEIDNQQVVSNPLAAVGAEIAFPGSR